MYSHIPHPVMQVLTTLERGGFEAYIVGGCVRDLLLNRTPKDWDVTTSALPEDILRLFPESFYENEFGTVGVKTASLLEQNVSVESTTAIVEVTPYRTESGYEDSRHPKTVTFSVSLNDDLARRDFTVNALAYGRQADGSWILVDPFQGQFDLEKKILRAVGNPEERFAEDALRLMRAVRLLAELRDPKETSETLQWSIEEKSFQAILKLSSNLSAISKERLRDELSKIILSPNAAFGIDMLHQTNLLRFIMPELELGIGVTQNLHHIYTVWEHNLRALATCPSPKLSVRLACLLHDVGKPHTKRGEGYRSTFYNHDHVGARLTQDILTRLRYPKDIVKHATLLVDNHLFYYNVGEVTEASVRRLVKRVGVENMDDLMAVRIGDRLGSGVPKAKPYKLRHLEYMIEKVSHDPLSVKMLAIKGTDLMQVLKIPPSPKIGMLLDILLSEVLEDPKINTYDALIERARILDKNDLSTLRQFAQEKIDATKKEEDVSLKKRHFVE